MEMHDNIHIVIVQYAVMNLFGAALPWGVAPMDDAPY